MSNDLSIESHKDFKKLVHFSIPEIRKGVITGGSFSVIESDSRNKLLKKKGGYKDKVNYPITIPNEQNEISEIQSSNWFNTKWKYEY